MSTLKEEVVERGLEYLSLRLKRGIYVEQELLSFIVNGVEEGDKKYFSELMQDAKSLSVKDVQTLLKLDEGEEQLSGFEDFDI